METVWFITLESFLGVTTLGLLYFNFLFYKRQDYGLLSYWVWNILLSLILLIPFIVTAMVDSFGLPIDFSLTVVLLCVLLCITGFVFQFYQKIEKVEAKLEILVSSSAIQFNDFKQRLSSLEKGNLLKNDSLNDGCPQQDDKNNNKSM